ncbi:MAG: redoxin family protein [Flavobacterium sp.]
MKKTLLSLLLLGGLSANAQLASGSTAPDFTATDINGVEHSLYADYLNQGKTVIIDISATWCGPCWRYHGTHALADFYETYGPNGSNEVVVLFIEGDPGTSVQSLYGTNTSSDTSTTQGNWTNHSPYPIIDDGTGAISNAYAIQYFPTVYMICPNGNVTELTNNANPPTAPILKSKITASCQTLTGAVNKARFDAVTTPICQQNGVVVAPLKNLGTNKILSATAVLKENGNVIATKNYTSTTGVSLFNTTNLTFPATNFTDGVHTIELTEINGLTTLPHPETATQDIDIILNNDTQVGNNLTVEIYTDFYPAEASWEIRNNSTNALVASGGPYTRGTEDQYGGGGPDANTTITSTVTLPDTDDCYKVILKDTAGDGWYFQTSNSYDPNAFRGIKILNGDNVVYEKNVNLAAFSTANFAAALRTVSVADAFQPGANKAFSVYPNPTNGILNIQSTENVSITVTDMAGKTVFAAKDIQNGGTINLGSLQKGIYIATMKGESGAQNSEKIVIN